MNITQITGIPYNPPGQSFVERALAQLKSYLKIKEWNQHDFKWWHISHNWGLLVGIWVGKDSVFFKGLDTGSLITLQWGYDLHKLDVFFFFFASLLGEATRGQILYEKILTIHYWKIDKMPSSKALISTLLHTFILTGLPTHVKTNKVPVHLEEL